MKHGAENVLHGKSAQVGTKVVLFDTDPLKSNMHLPCGNKWTNIAQNETMLGGLRESFIFRTGPCHRERVINVCDIYTLTTCWLLLTPARVQSAGNLPLV
jgi:hypothetical protein